jgi:hypothetical protein
VIEVVRYSPAHKEVWDRFVASAKNSVFLFARDYMDYHSDRFVDHSLLFEQDGRLVGVLPASQHEAVLVSHGGLTFGGILTDAEMSASLMLEVFVELLRYLQQAGIDRLLYKAVPPTYHEVPAEEDRYALFRCGARLYRRDVTFTIPLARRLPFQQRRRRGVKKAQAAGLRLRTDGDLSDFWPVLEENLRHRHNLRPVHTLDEIQLLRNRFPNNIKLFAAYEGGDLQAGVVVYENRRIAHAQYMAASERGRRVGALDFVFDYLISDHYRDLDYFDFGVSTEDQGRALNVGLAEQKEGFGARAVVHDFYELNVATAAA